VLNCVSAFSSITTRRSLTDQDNVELEYLTLTHIRWKMKTFLLRVTVTLTKTQMVLLTQPSHSGLAVKTVDLQSTGLQGVHMGYDKQEPPHTSRDPSPLSVLTARQGRQALSISHLKIFDTRHNRHCIMQCKRVRCLHVPPKTKKQE
jgi:hypothetical protein